MGCKSVLYFYGCLKLQFPDDEVNPGPMVAPQCCRVMFTIINGLHGYRDELAIAATKFDVVACAETKGPHQRQRFSIATAMCSQIAVVVAVYGLPTHAATNLFNLSQLNRSSLTVTMSDLASDDQIAHQISENSDQQQPQQRPPSCGGGCGCWSPYTGNLVEVAVGNCGCD